MSKFRRNDSTTDGKMARCFLETGYTCRHEFQKRIDDFCTQGGNDRRHHTMTLYSIDSLIEETRRLAAEFRRTTGTMLPVSGEIARYDVCQKLNLLPNECRSDGYDATGLEGERKGLKIQIKSRVVGDRVKSGHRIGQLNLEKDWDRLILSLMNHDFEPTEMYELGRDQLTAIIQDKSRQSKRGMISVARFRAVGKKVWSCEETPAPASK